MFATAIIAFLVFALLTAALISLVRCAGPAWSDVDRDETACELPSEEPESESAQETFERIRLEMFMQTELPPPWDCPLFECGGDG